LWHCPVSPCLGLMSKRIQSFLKARASSQDPDRPGCAKAETLMKTKQIQDALAWQTINSHFDKSAKANGPARGLEEFCSATSAVQGRKICSMDMFDSTYSDKSELSLTSDSTRQSELGLLVRKFQDSHAELGRRVLEVQDIVHQLSNAGNDFVRELQIYELLVKDSTARFSALSQKLFRLQTKIELSSSVRNGKQRSQRLSPPTTEPTDSQRDSNCTQQQSLMQAKAPEQAPVHGYFARRATSVQHGGRISMIDESKVHRSGTAPLQRRPVSQTRHVHELPSKLSAASCESAKVTARSEAQPRTEGDLPRMTPGDRPRLEQPSLQLSIAGGESAKATLQFETRPKTLGDLPRMTQEDLVQLGQRRTLPDLPNLDMEDSSEEDQD